MKALTRGVLGFVGSLAAFAVAWDAAAQDYTSNFEDGGTGWTYQHLNSQFRWKVDNQPLIFVSPDKKLDTLDDLTQAQETDLSGTALSPPASFAFVGPRFVSFWCYVHTVNTHPNRGVLRASRKLRIGPDPLTNPGFTWNFWFSTPQATWTNPTQGMVSVEIVCPEDQWHQHIVTSTASGLPTGPGIVTTIITADPDKLEELFILRAEYTFKHDREQINIVGTFGGTAEEVHKVNIYWAIDNLRISQFLQDPFAPQPQFGSARGETGGSSEGCGTTSVEIFRPPGGGPGPGGVLLLLAVAAVLWPLRLYLPRFRFERQPVE